MRTLFTTRIPVIIAMLLIFMIQSCDQKKTANIKNSVTMIEQSDPRFKLLAEQVPSLVIENQLLSDVIDQAKIPTLLKSPVIIRGELKGKRLSINFSGGTLSELLQIIGNEAMATIKFEKYCVAFEPNNGIAKKKSE